MKKTKKRALTLLEIMIVIFLIGLIGSVIGYNMKGSLDEGRYFKTKQAAQQVRDILLLEVAKGSSTIDQVIDTKEEALKNSGLVKDPTKLLKDGWGTEFAVTKDGDDIKVTTTKYDEWRKKKGE